MTGETGKPPPPPEAVLVKRAMKAKRWSAPRLAAEASLSSDWTRNLINGYRSVGKGEFRPVRADEYDLAEMARAVGISEADLRRVGRGDAADALARLREDPKIEHAGHIDRLTKIRDDLDALIADWPCGS